MGNMGQRAVRLVSNLPASDAEEIILLCPFLSGLDPMLGMWLGPLAWHDCNATLLAALASALRPVAASVFAGVFCADPFRLTDDLLDTLCVAGIAGVVNLPSVSFLDGEFGQTLASLHLGVERELGFLRRARARGFRVAGCACALSDAQAMCAAGAELIISHSGPPLPERAHKRDPWARRLDVCGVQVVSLSSLIAEHIEWQGKLGGNIGTALS